MFLMHQQKLSRPLQLALNIWVKPNLRIRSCTTFCAAVQRLRWGALEQMPCSDGGKDKKQQRSRQGRSHRFFSWRLTTTENIRPIFKLDKLRFWKSEHQDFLMWLLTCWCVVLEVQSESRLCQHFSWSEMIHYYYFISSLHTRIAPGDSCKNQLFSVLSAKQTPAHVLWGRIYKGFRCCYLVEEPPKSHSSATAIPSPEADLISWLLF